MYIYESNVAQRCNKCVCVAVFRDGVYHQKSIFSTIRAGERGRYPGLKVNGALRSGFVGRGGGGGVINHFIY